MGIVHGDEVGESGAIKHDVYLERSSKTEMTLPCQWCSTYRTDGAAVVIAVLLFQFFKIEIKPERVS